MKIYGKELILDIHNCNPEIFTRTSIKNYFVGLCKLINMERCDLHFWDYDGEQGEYEKAPDHLKGISAIQFISTSNITIHTLDVLKKAYINIFSCKDFDEKKATEFSVNWFEGQIETLTIVNRI